LVIFLPFQPKYQLSDLSFAKAIRQSRQSGPLPQPRDIDEVRIPVIVSSDSGRNVSTDSGAS